MNPDAYRGVVVTLGQPLRLYNSRGRRADVFTPTSDGGVGMYSCGPTVYGFPHLGNMRAYVFADTLRRALRWNGFPARHVVSITDVGHVVAETELGEDKLERAAHQEQRSVWEIAEFYTEAFFVDLTALRILPADHYPRATAYIPEMIRFAQELEGRGYGYQIPSGLYFNSSKLDGYGALALMDREGQQEGARVEHVEGRRHKTDFALWRAEQPGQVRAMRWESPWGWGAPGWHLECSVMSMALLGPHFDIHTGGVDHRELHHVNEIAQSEAYLGDGKPWVRFWLHNEFLQLHEQKISKSAGRAPRLADLLADGLHPLSYRLFLLGGHYRRQLDLTDAAVEANQATMGRLLGRVEALRPLPQVSTLREALALLSAGASGDERAASLLEQAHAAISNDLNTPQLLAVLQETLRADEVSDTGRAVVVAAADTLLGLGLGELKPEELAKGSSGKELPAEDVAEIERLLAERERARGDKDWAGADEIRARLEKRGVLLTDTSSGTEWSLR